MRKIDKVKILEMVDKKYSTGNTVEAKNTFLDFMDRMPGDFELKARDAYEISERRGFLNSLLVITDWIIDSRPESMIGYLLRLDWYAKNEANASSLDFASFCLEKFGQDASLLMKTQQIAFASGNYNIAFEYAVQLILSSPKDRRFYRRASRAYTMLKENVNFSTKLLDLIEIFTLADLRAVSEYRTTRFWHDLMSCVYKRSVKVKFNYNAVKGEDKKPKVFIFCQNIKEGKTSSHLAVVADLMKNYHNNGYDTRLVVCPHPYTGLGKKGGYAVPNDDRDESEYASSIKYWAHELTGLDLNNLHVDILNGYRDVALTVGEFIDIVLSQILNYSFGKRDVIFLLGGVNGSVLLSEISRILPSRKFYFMMSGNNEIFPVSNIADYVLYSSLDSNKPTGRARQSGFPEDRLIGNDIPMSPFYWELSNSIELSCHEKKVLNAVEKHNGSIFVSATLNFEKRANKEFFELLFLLDDFDSKVVLIGTTKEKMVRSFPEFSGYIAAKIEFIEKSESIYTLFSELSKRNAYYILPRIAGSGRTNTYAGISGMPVFLFHGNDAERRFPESCIYDTVQDMFFGIKNVIYCKENYVKKMLTSIYNHEAASKEFQVKILDDTSYPARK